MQLPKVERHRLIASVVSRKRVGTQFELLDALSDAGCSVADAVCVFAWSGVFSY